MIEFHHFSLCVFSYHINCTNGGGPTNPVNDVHCPLVEQDTNCGHGYGSYTGINRGFACHWIVQTTTVIIIVVVVAEGGAAAGQ